MQYYIKLCRLHQMRLVHMVPMMVMMIMMVMIGDVASTLFRNGAHCLTRHCIVVACAASYIHLNCG